MYKVCDDKFYFCFQSQAQECVYESLTLDRNTQGVLQYGQLAQEASLVNEPPHKKTNTMHRRKQRRRSAVQLLHS